MKKMSKIVLAALLAVAMLEATAGIASAALSAPKWMPNSPILAGSQVILLWVPVPGAVKYNVYLNGKKIADSVTIQYMTPSPETAGEHKFEIAAVDSGGTESPKSPPGIVRIVTIEPPVSVFSRASSEGRISLKWDSVKGAVAYNVYRADKEGGESKLLASVQSDGFTDSGLEVGKTYFYTVSSKDLGGKESPRSKVHRQAVPRPAEKVQEVAKVELKIFPSREISTSKLKDPNQIKQYKGLTAGPGNFLYVVDASRNEVVKVGMETMEVVKTIGCGKEPDVQCKASFFAAAAVSKDGRLYVLDSRMKKVMVFDTDGKFQSEFEVKDPSDKNVLSAVPEDQKAKGVGIAGIAVDENGKVLYVSDSNFNTIHKFDLDGKFLGTMGHGGTTEKDFLGPATITLSPSGDLLYVSLPLIHVIQVVDTKTGEVVRAIGKGHNNYIGGFIGVGGMSTDAGGNLYVSDSGVHTIQVFDGKTGRYIGHVGDESGQPDEGQKNRASLDGIQFPVGVTVVGENKICFFRGDKNQVTCRELVRK